jgi:hypothetical protein
VIGSGDGLKLSLENRHAFLVVGGGGFGDFEGGFEVLHFGAEARLREA